MIQSKGKNCDEPWIPIWIGEASHLDHHRHPRKACRPGVDLAYKGMVAPPPSPIWVSSGEKAILYTNSSTGKKKKTTSSSLTTKSTNELIHAFEPSTIIPPCVPSNNTYYSTLKRILNTHEHQDGYEVSRNDR
jgi:hypothetical protein